MDPDQISTLCDALTNLVTLDDDVTQARDSGTTLQRLTPRALQQELLERLRVDILGSTQTFARFHNLNSSQDLFAESGWSASRLAYVPTALLDRRLYTERVRRLCRAINYTLEAHSLDRDYRGQFNDCHAEKQIMVAIIWQLLGWGSASRPKQRRESWVRLEAFHHLPYSAPLVEMDVYISHKKGPCPDCSHFQRHTYEKAGVCFRILFPESVDHMHVYT